MDLDFFEDAWWYERTWGWKISPDKTFFKKEFHVRIHADFISSIKTTSINKKYIYIIEPFICLLIMKTIN